MNNRVPGWLKAVIYVTVVMSATAGAGSAASGSAPQSATACVALRA
jgi:hypothetical protein